MKQKATILAILAICGSYESSQAADPPRIKVKAEMPLVLPPDTFFGEVAGVTVNSKGNVLVFSRGNSSGPAYAATAAQLLEFDSSGKFIREIGKHVYSLSFAHSVRVDKEDNIWTVDKGSNMIVEFNPQGQVMQVYGRKPEASDYRTPTADAPHDLKAPIQRAEFFNQPTDVAFDSNGDFYITDGYENSRVAKYNKDGNWIKSWGERGTGPGQFLTPHNVVIDNRDNVYVADRGNNRVQVFDTNGRFLRQFTLQGQVPFYALKEGQPNPFPSHISGSAPKPRGDDPAVSKAYPDVPPANLSSTPGAPDAMCIIPGEHQVLYIADTNPSRIYKVSLEGKVLGMMGDPGRKVGEFRAIHAIACPDDHTIWVADLYNWRAQKLTLQ